MDWCPPPNCGTRRLSDTCLPIFSPATFSSRCKFPQRKKPALDRTGLQVAAPLALGLSLRIAGLPLLTQGFLGIIQMPSRNMKAWRNRIPATSMSISIWRTRNQRGLEFVLNVRSPPPLPAISLNHGRINIGDGSHLRSGCPRLNPGAGRRSLQIMDSSTCLPAIAYSGRAEEASRMAGRRWRFRRRFLWR